jgi:hypothetical protein
VCYGAGVWWTNRRLDIRHEVHKAKEVLDIERLTIPTHVTTSVTTALDLALSGANRVKSFAFYRAARVKP